VTAFDTDAQIRSNFRPSAEIGNDRPNLPIEQATNFALRVNLKTVSIPPSILVRAIR
jgi:hypothetical protein